MKNSIIRVFCFALIVAFMVAPFFTGISTTSASSATGALFTNVTGKVDLSSIAMQNLNSQATTSNTKHTVIVSLSGKTLVEEADGADVAEYALSKEGQKVDASLRDAQDDFLADLSKNGISYKLKYRYTAIDNAVAITIDTKYVSQIKKMSGVKSVVLSETYLAPESVDMGTYAQASDEELDDALKNATAVVNKTSVYDTGVYDSSYVMETYGYKGGGSVVAIVDTGLDYTHNAFVWDDAHSEVYSLDNAVFTKSSVERVLQNKTMQAEERSLLNGKVIDVNDVYISQKVPFAYDYADSDADVYPSYSNHGTHVAGIVAGYDPDGYTDKNGEHVDEPFVGVAPEAQLVICKVFTDDLDDDDIGGAETEDILAALEDCILLGVDVINMSLGTSCGFSTTDDGDEEGEELNRVYNAVGTAGISLVCAASNDYSASYGGNFGTNLSSNPDSGTVGSPSLFAAALSVASISGKTSPFFMANPTDSYDGTPVYYEESSDQYNKYYEFATMILGGESVKSFEYVRISGVGRDSDFLNVGDKLKGRIALIKRGSSTFKEKVELAMSYGAIGVIVYNNVSGTIRMSLGEIENPVPSCCISMDAGNAMAEYASAHGGIGTITVDISLKAGPFMSEFSSWGVTPDLKLKPEITAHGGEITSAVPGGYGEQSGTSMASPNMAGVVSIIRSYLKETQPTLSTNELTQRINQLIMSTANIVYDRENLPYSPRKQGAGLGSLDNAISTKVYLYTEDDTIDYRPKVNLGDDIHKTGIYTVSFNVNNFGTEDYTFELNSLFMTETLSSDGLAVAEQAYMLDDIPFEFTVSGGITKDGNNVIVPAGSDGKISVKLTLSGDERNYIEDSFSNGMYVEGFIQLISSSDNQCDLVLPFMGFYGDWTEAPMLEYSAYEIAESEQDTAIDDEDKLKASIWATQPYTMYYNEQYSMPMGSFSYIQDENADQIYTSMEHNAISCYNIYYGEDDPNNYLTAYQFRGLYVGLLRGARKVSYNMKNVDTGEIIYENVAYRINKAYTQGGSGGVPGYIKFELDPLECGLVSNGQYEMNFYFYLDYGDKDREKADDTFSFTFYADYEAPVIEDIRVRYQDYKENNKDKQRIYLDLDVYDNHYPQSALLCYFDGEMLQQATQYVTPIYNSVKNGTNTVSIEITDIYDSYKELYVQIDDYALNHSVYFINLNNANPNTSSDEFELASGEDKLSLDIYETHTVKLNYSGDANISNFTWGSTDVSVVGVKNGEIVGLSEGSAVVTVSNGKGIEKQIEVTVSGNKEKLSTPTLSFGPLADANEKLVAGSGTISLYPDQNVQLVIQTDPWWYPKETLNLVWKSTDSSIIDVDQNGNLDIKKKGTASIMAVIINDKGNETAYSAVVTINVPDPFVISGYTLTKYRGKDKLVEIPDDKTLLYIGSEAFKDNDTMEEVIIPKTVMNINENAFENCSQLKAIYLVSKEKQAIPDADLKLVYRYAFKNCKSLELIDLTNVKVITLGIYAFTGCSSLKEIKNMQAVGTAFTGAFEGCTSLTSVDLTGMHVTGNNVFKDCTSLSEVVTGKYTAIGDYMFYNCTSLKSIEINGATVGNNAFEKCSKLTTVSFGSTNNDCIIGSEAFYNSGLRKVSYVDGFTALKIGSRAFANTKLTSITLPEGLIELGANLFKNTLTLTEIVLPASFTFEQIQFSGTLFTGIQVTLSESSDYVISDGVLYNKDKSTLYALYDNKATSIVVPDSVERIYDYAFANSGILEITIPASVTSIGKGAFKDSNLTKITFNGNGITVIEDETFRNSGIYSIDLPTSVKSVGSYAFASSNIASIDLSNVKSIGSYAFYDCAKLKTISLSDELEYIGDYAFLDCVLVEELNIPSAKEIGEGILIGMASLKNVIMGDGVESIGEYTFFGLTALETVELGRGIDVISESSFYGCESLRSVKHNGIVEVEEYAFSLCYALEDLDFSTIEVIGDMAFNNCNSLKVLNLEKAREIGVGAFAMDNKEGGVTEINLAVAEIIGASSFENTDITSVTIPASLTEIGFASFAYCSSLTEILVSSDNGVYFSENGILYKTTLSGGVELIAYPGAKLWTDETFVVSDNVIRIEAYAFAGLIYSSNSKDEISEAGDNGYIITKVELPHSILSIGDSAFFESGIVEYTFTSYNAPVLESVYKEEVEEILRENFVSYEDPAINSYYYSNFNTLFVYYIDMVGKTSDLVINRPVNGIGYDNFVYSRYFGVKNDTDIVMDDTTRGYIETMESFVESDTYTLWENAINEGDTSYKDAVEKFAEIVMEARRLFDNIKEESQLAYVDSNLIVKLEEAETTMRTIKSLYGIEVTIKRLAYETTGYKYNYIEGEYFDMTGVKVFIVYDDGSTEYIPSKNLSLLTTGELKYYNQDVEIAYVDDNGEYILDSARNKYVVYVGIKVKQADKVDNIVDDENNSDDSPNLLGVWIALGVVGGVVVLAGVAITVILVLKKKKSVVESDEPDNKEALEETPDSEDTLVSEETLEEANKIDGDEDNDI